MNQLKVLDYADIEVKADDYVLRGDGRIFKLLATEDTVKKYGLYRAIEWPKGKAETLVRAYHCFRICGEEELKSLPKDKKQRIEKFGEWYRSTAAKGKVELSTVAMRNKANQTLIEMGVRKDDSKPN